jgi:type VI protein secretion system component Hcp
VAVLLGVSLLALGLSGVVVAKAATTASPPSFQSQTNLTFPMPTSQTPPTSTVVAINVQNANSIGIPTGGGWSMAVQCLDSTNGGPQGSSPCPSGQSASTGGGCPVTWSWNVSGSAANIIVTLAIPTAAALAKAQSCQSNPVYNPMKMTFTATGPGGGPVTSSQFTIGYPQSGGGTGGGGTGGGGTGGGGTGGGGTSGGGTSGGGTNGGGTNGGGSGLVSCNGNGGTSGGGTGGGGTSGGGTNGGGTSGGGTSGGGTSGGGTSGGGTSGGGTSGGGTSGGGTSGGGTSGGGTSGGGPLPAGPIGSGSSAASPSGGGLYLLTSGVSGNSSLPGIPSGGESIQGWSFAGSTPSKNGAASGSPSFGSVKVTMGASSTSPTYLAQFGGKTAVSSVEIGTAQCRDSNGASGQSLKITLQGVLIDGYQINVDPTSNSGAAEVTLSFSATKVTVASTALDLNSGLWGATTSKCIVTSTGASCS